MTDGIARLRKLTDDAFASIATPGSSTAPVVRYLRWQEERGLYAVKLLLDLVESANRMSSLLRGYDYSDGSLAGKLLADYDAKHAALEKAGMP